MSARSSAPSASNQQNLTGYNFSAPTWTTEDKANYIAETIESREPNGFATDEFLGAWSNASLSLTKDLAIILGDSNLDMAVQNNNWQNVENIFK
eukprot:4343473-Karenia_brevis.AAC.1